MTVATYTIAADGKTITCMRCGLTSHNRTDVAERYCGRCHGFHGQTLVTCAEPGCEVILVLILGTRLPRRCAAHDPQ